MGRNVALLGACVFALAAPTSGTKAWDLLLGQDDALPKTTIPETLTIPETMEAAPEHDFLADYEASVQEAAAALPLLMNVSFVNPEGLPAADPRLQTDATTVQPQQPLSSRTVSASAGENNNQRSCPVMRVNEQPIREACANNPEESCTKCLPELSNQLVPQLLTVDPPFTSAAEIQETAMRCFPAQVPVLAPLVPELPSLLSCDLQAVLNNIDLTKFETFRTPENAHLFDEAVDLFQEVNGAGEMQGNGQAGVPSTEGDAETPRWYEGPFEPSAAAAVTTVTTAVFALVAAAAALA